MHNAHSATSPPSTPRLNVLSSAIDDLSIRELCFLMLLRRSEEKRRIREGQMLRV
jgi:hypothetical protein